MPSLGSGSEVDTPPYNGGVSISSVARVALKILGPTLLGFGTIFQPKASPSDHWSTTPRITIQVEVSADESGNPPAPDEERCLIVRAAA